MSESKTTFLGRRIGYNEEKRKKDRAKRIKNSMGRIFRWYKRCGWIFSILLIVVGVVSWNYRFYLQRFNPMELRYLQYIDIEGNRMLSLEDVVQNAQVEPGMRMSELNADSVEKILLQMPLIYSATVKKYFPSSLDIKIKESSPILSVFEFGKATVYSERGMVLPLSMTTAFHLPVVDIESKERIKPISRFLNAMRDENKKLYNKVSQVSWSDKDKAFEVFFRDVDYKVLFPEMGWGREMFVMYESLKTEFLKEMRCASEIDMRYTGFAYIRFLDKRCVNG